MSGNPVKIGDGCATVTGYKLPQPLILWIGKAGARSSPKSGYRFDCARPTGGVQSLTPKVQSHSPTLDMDLRLWTFLVNFSVKRRMRPARSVCADRDSLSAFILCFAGMKAFLFPSFSFSSSSSSSLLTRQVRGRG